MHSKVSFESVSVVNIFEWERERVPMFYAGVLKIMLRNSEINFWNRKIFASSCFGWVIVEKLIINVVAETVSIVIVI